MDKVVLEGITGVHVNRTGSAYADSLYETKWILVIR